MDIARMRASIANSILLVFSIFFSFGLLEVGARFYKNEFNYHNFLEIKQDLFRSAYPSEFDPQLGWIPKKGVHPRNVWNTKVSILDDGIRSNGDSDEIWGGNTILAVGDSFTFGDQVSDGETWPAILENLSKTRVINGGVFGYGVDQSFLRMQTLSNKYNPEAIVFSLILDDIFRNELSARTSVPKPYFDVLETGELELKTNHISPPGPPEAMDPFRKIFGYSFLVHKLVSRVFPGYWLQGNWTHTKAHSKGVEITCRIFDKLKQISQSEDVDIYILIQYPYDGIENKSGVIEEITRCIDRDVLNLVDLRMALAKLKDSNYGRYKNLYDRHMTPEGNAFVASILRRVVNEHIEYSETYSN